MALLVIKPPGKPGIAIYFCPKQPKRTPISETNEPSHRRGVGAIVQLPGALGLPQTHLLHGRPPAPVVVAVPQGVQQGVPLLQAWKLEKELLREILRGWLRNPFRTTWKPWLKPLSVGICRGIIILGCLRWCRISSIHSMCNEICAGRLASNTVFGLVFFSNLLFHLSTQHNRGQLAVGWGGGEGERGKSCATRQASTSRHER